jgi:hypothetical protein
MGVARHRPLLPHTSGKAFAPDERLRTFFTTFAAQQGIFNTDFRARNIRQTGLLLLLVRILQTLESWGLYGDWKFQPKRPQTVFQY